MRFRKVSPALIESNKAKLLGINRVELEALYLAEGNIANVIHGMIAAKNAGLNLTFKKACKADLAGFDIID